MASNEEEPMETDEKLPEPKPKYDTTSQEDKGELRVRVTSPDECDPKKVKFIITTALQSWVNKNSLKVNFTVTELSNDLKTAVISVTPADALQELQSLSGQKLMTKDKKCFSFTPILEPAEDDKKTSEDFSSLTQQQAQNGSVELSDQNVPGDDQKEPPRIVALGPYWYLTNTYPDKIQRIEKENGVKITESVAVTINAEDKKNTNPKKASDEFTQLVQSCIDESKGESVPLKDVGSEKWKETLKYLKTTNHKCQITISADQITVFGPPEYRRALIKSLKSTKIHTNFPEEMSYPEKGSNKMATNFTDDERMDLGRPGIKSHEYTSDRDRRSPNRVKVTSSFKDPFVTDGLPVEGHHWEAITKVHMKEFGRIQDKFNVRFSDSDTTGGQKMIKVQYNKTERNVSMESHAIRALLRLYQKVALFQMRPTNGSYDHKVDLSRAGDDTYGAAGKREDKSSKGPTEEREESKPKGAEAKKDETEDTCPVCMDTFTQKMTLKCKHEFCEACLDQSIKSLGPTCPVCKDVFGKVEGNQPDGTMTWRRFGSSLPGFKNCGTIEINYHIPSGTQTSKHPNPGQHYHGASRTAYLPDNREGNEVLMLLKKAFDQRLIFTVGMSRTTGEDNVVTWNDIHHKTHMHGGPQSFGYPDPDYLSRVKEELKAKGVK